MSGARQEERGVHGQIARLARRLHGAAGGSGVKEPSTVLAEITRAAVDVLPDVDHAGVTLVRRAGSGTRPAELQSTAATGAIPELVDRLQHETGRRAVSGRRVATGHDEHLRHGHNPQSCIKQ